MVKKTKVVIDTNVFISAFGWGGKPLTIIQLLERGIIKNFTSEEILNEFCIAIAYPKLNFNKKLQLNILEFVMAFSEICEADEHLEVTSDPHDNKFISCAISAQAKFIITVDKQFLSLKKYKEINVITPEEFLSKFE